MSFWDSYYGTPKKKRSSKKIISIGGRKYVAIGSTRRSKPRQTGYSYGGYSYPSSRGEHISASDLYYGGKGAYMVGKKIAKSRPVQSLKRKVSNRMDERRFEKAGFKSTKLNLGTSRSSYFK